MEDDAAYPFTTTIQQDQDQQKLPIEDAHQHQHHHLASIDSTLVIRQLQSQGLSFQIWPAANALVALLQQHHQQPNTGPLSSIFTTRPLRILELGSGTGLVGIAAAAILGAAVTITDLPHVLPNLVFNAAANSAALVANHGGVVVEALRWGEAEDMEAVGTDFDVIVGSDVVYHDNLYQPLLKTLRFYLGEGSERVFVMAHLKRWKKESSFFNKARRMFRVSTLHSDLPLPGARVGVVVYSFANRCRDMISNPTNKPELVLDVP